MKICKVIYHEFFVVALIAFCSPLLLAQLTPGAPPVAWKLSLTPPVSGLAVDPTGVYVSGQRSNQGFLNKYAKDGAQAWQRAFPSAPGPGSRVAADGTAVYTAHKGIMTVQGYSRVVTPIEKRDPDGNLLWSGDLGTTRDPYAIAANSTGVYVGGNDAGTNLDAWLRKYDPAGRYDPTSGQLASIVWRIDSFGVNSQGFVAGLGIDDDNAAYAAGHFSSSDTYMTNKRAFVYKYASDSTGSPVWTREFALADHPDSEWTYVSAACADATGVYVAGTVLEDAGGVLAHAFVRKYDKEGNELWTHQFPSGVVTTASAAVCDGTGVYIAGVTNGAFPGYTNAGGTDWFLRKYDKEGSEIWTYQFGATSINRVGGIAVDGDAVYVAGDDGGSGFVVKLIKNQMTGAVLEQLKNIVESLNLKQGIVNSLDAKLQNVMNALAATNAGDRQDAINKLQAFINACEAQRGKAMLGADVDLLEGIAYGIMSMIQPVQALLLPPPAPAPVLQWRQTTVESYIPRWVAVNGTGVYAADSNSVHKYDTNGNALWFEVVSTAEERNIGAFSVDQTGVYLAGSISNWPSPGADDAWARRYDFDGNTMWTQQFGAPNPPDAYYDTMDRAYGIAADNAGIYVVGETWGSLTGQPNAGEGDAFMRKYESNGNDIWTVQFGWEGRDYLSAVSVAGTAVYATGQSINLDGTVRSKFLRRYDNTGNLIWNREVAGPLGFLSADASGVYTLSVNRTTETYLHKYDPYGNELWAKTLPYCRGSGVGFAADGHGVYLVGGTDFEPVRSTCPDPAYVRKYDGNGDEVWTYPFGTANSVPSGVAFDGQAVYVTGSTMDLIDPQLTQFGGFIAKLLKPETAALQQLLALVQLVNLNAGMVNSFDAKLQNVSDSLAAVNAGQRQDAVNKLAAFINVCEAQRYKQLASADTDILIGAANNIMGMLQ